MTDIQSPISLDSEAPEPGRYSVPEPPRLSISEMPFGIEPTDLAASPERAPLLHAFSLAVADELRRRSRLLDWLGMSAPSQAAECGVFQGHSMAACLTLADRYGLRLSMTGLDTFKGLPPLSEVDIELAPVGISYRKRTLFANTSRQNVETTLDARKGRSTFKLVEGLFSETLPTLPDRKYFFVNIDCDLYNPHIECMRYFYPRLQPGGIMFFDDYHSLNYPMAKKAVDDFLSDKPERLWHVRHGEDGENITKAFIKRHGPERSNASIG